MTNHRQNKAILGIFISFLRSDIFQSRYFLDSVQVLRICAQALQDLGLDKSAAAVQSESGIQLTDYSILELQHLMQEGNWSEAKTLTTTLEIQERQRKVSPL